MPDDYYLHHADAYDDASRGVPGDLEFYLNLAVESGGPVVELGVGTGRIAIPIAQAGIEVIGIDNAEPMLAIARRKARAAGVEARLRLVVGDMRAFAVERPVPLVTLPYRTFLHNLELDDQVATLEACYRALVPGGRLALNVFNPDLRFIDSWSALSPDEWNRTVAGTPSPVVRSTLRVRDSAGVRHDARLELRYVRREEMEQLFRETGFVVEARYGDFVAAPMAAHSPELIWISVRR
jgi:ubiquinone/menaquinone biosynthesis C-methylase UbiE